MVELLSALIGPPLAATVGRCRPLQLARQPTILPSHLVACYLKPVTHVSISPGRVDRKVRAQATEVDKFYGFIGRDTEPSTWHNAHGNSTGARRWIFRRHAELVCG